MGHNAELSGSKPGYHACNVPDQICPHTTLITTRNVRVAPAVTLGPVCEELDVGNRELLSRTDSCRNTISS